MKNVVPFPSKRPHVQVIPSDNAFCQQSESGPVATKVQSEKEFFDELHQDTKNALAGNLPAPVSTFALSRDAWRAQLLAAAEFKTSPLDYEETAGFVEAHLTRESYTATKNILTTFGVVKVPGLMTADELVETLLSLAGGHGATISARAHPHFKTRRCSMTRSARSLAQSTRDASMRYGLETWKQSGSARKSWGWRRA